MQRAGRPAVHCQARAPALGCPMPPVLLASGRVRPARAEAHLLPEPAHWLSRGLLWRLPAMAQLQRRHGHRLPHPPALPSCRFLQSPLPPSLPLALTLAAKKLSRAPGCCCYSWRWLLQPAAQHAPRHQIAPAGDELAPHPTAPAAAQPTPPAAGKAAAAPAGAACWAEAARASRLRCRPSWGRGGLAPLLQAQCRRPCCLAGLQMRLQSAPRRPTRCRGRRCRGRGPCRHAAPPQHGPPDGAAHPACACSRTAGSRLARPPGCLRGSGQPGSGRQVLLGRKLLLQWALPARLQQTTPSSVSRAAAHYKQSCSAPGSRPGLKGGTSWPAMSSGRHSTPGESPPAAPCCAGSSSDRMLLPSAGAAGGAPPPVLSAAAGATARRPAAPASSPWARCSPCAA